MTRHSQAQQHYRRTGAEVQGFRFAIERYGHDPIGSFQNFLGQSTRLIAEQHRFGPGKRFRRGNYIRQGFRLSGIRAVYIGRIH